MLRSGIASNSRTTEIIPLTTIVDAVLPGGVVVAVVITIVVVEETVTVEVAVLMPLLFEIKCDPPPVMTTEPKNTVIHSQEAMKEVLATVAEAK